MIRIYFHRLIPIITCTYMFILIYLFEYYLNEEAISKIQNKLSKY